MIEAGCDDTPGAAKDIAEAAKRAHELIAQILDFSKDVSPDTSTFHMAQVVRNALQFVQGSLPANVKVETKLDADPDTVCAIEGKMQLMVMNLLSNAGDAMEEEGGVLNVELKSVSEGVQLIVSDTGPGIPDKVLSRIFEPFFTTKPLGRGSGLGLPMVREAVEEAGGTLDLVSRPGDGTTFTILLPASEKTASSEPKEKSNCGPLKILVVDDEPQVLTVTGKMLLHLGHEPICFGSSAEALAYDGKYDLVLTDYHIDGSSGVELAEQLKDFDGPVILVTGNYDSQQELPPRISSKINKPFTLKTLRETLASVTGQ